MAVNNQFDEINMAFNKQLEESNQQLDELSIDKRDFLMVASIDFGTTFSGYAFSFTSSKQEFRMNKNWGEAAGHQSFKVSNNCNKVSE